MRNLNQDTITEAVLARFANTPDPRLKEIISSLVTHLHNFARYVKLTEEEWFYGIQYVTATAGPVHAHHRHEPGQTCGLHRAHRVWPFLFGERAAF